LSLCGATHVIDVAVREPDFVNGDPGLSNGTFDAREVPARIDHHGTLAGVAPKYRAVLLERRDRDEDGLGFGHGDAHRLGLKLAERGGRAAAYHTAPGIDNVCSQAASCIATTIGSLSISEYKHQ
jgi:hypothetical protein